MKKVFSILMAVLMLTSMLSLFAVSTSAADAPAATTGKVFKLYISDAGDDSANDGLTPEKPMKTLMPAIKKIEEFTGPDKEYTSAQLILAGTLTISTAVELHEKCPWGSDFELTITSMDKHNYPLKISNTLRLGGDTFFTNIKVLETASKFMWAMGYKLTMGAYGIENDVITLDKDAGSLRPLTIIGGQPNAPDSVSKIYRGIDVTINSGTYKRIICEETYGGWCGGDLNITINGGTIIGDAETSGMISVGGQFLGESIIGGAFICEGDVNIEINGGTLNNAVISLGWTCNKINKNRNFYPGTKYEVNLVSGNYGKNIFCGDVNVDINGGSFTDVKIGRGNVLNTLEGKYADMADHLTFEKGITVDLTNIKEADKATFKAFVVDETVKVVEHSKTAFEDLNDTQHKAYCPCGCGLSETVNHTYDAGEITKQPTHTVAGEKTYTCADCKGTKLETISPDTNTHNYTTGWVKVDDTNHKKTCDDPACPDANKGAVTEAHTFDAGVDTKAATHLEDGEKTYTCSVCTGTKVEVVPKTTEHDMGIWGKHDANQHKRSCECGETEYADHAWNKGKVTTEATVEAEGVMTYTCSVCSETKTEAIAKLPAPETQPTTEPAKEGGCSSTVGFGIAAVVMAGAAVAFVPKKKED